MAGLRQNDSEIRLLRELSNESTTSSSILSQQESDWTNKRATFKIHNTSSSADETLIEEETRSLSSCDIENGVFNNDNDINVKGSKYTTMELKCTCKCGGYMNLGDDISCDLSCKSYRGSDPESMDSGYKGIEDESLDSFREMDIKGINRTESSHKFSIVGNEYSKQKLAARHESGVGLLQKTQNIPAKDERLSRMLILRTASMYMAYFSLGSFNVLLGPTLLNLEVLFETDLKTMTLTFTGTGLGYLLGVILCGIIFDRLNKEGLLALCVLLVSLCHGFAPWFGNVFVYIVFIGMASVGLGIIDAGIQSYCMNLWHGHRYKNAIFHGLHLMAALGNLLCPLIIGPFLAELNTSTNQNSSSEIHNNSNSLSIVIEEETAYGEALQKYILPNTTDDVLTNIIEYLHVNYTSTNLTAMPLDVSGVKYAYVTMAFVTLPGAVLFCVSWFITKSKTTRETLEDSIKANVDREGEAMENIYNTTRRFRVILLAMLFMYFFLYLLLSAMPVALMSAFAVKGLNWSMRNGVLLTSTVLFGFTGVRIISIFISVFISPTTMIYTNCFLMIAVQTVLLFAQQLPDYVIWSCACAMGISVATGYASVMLWMSEHMRVTGKAASVCIFGMSVAFVVGPSSIGYLFQTYTPMYFIYTIFLASLLQLICFTSMVIFTKCCKPKSLKNKYYIENIQNQNDILQKGEC